MKAMRLIALILTAAFLAQGVNAQTADLKQQPAPEVDYTDWLFVQGDKALQYRFGVAKKEGDLSHLRLQFRVKTDEEVHCRGAECDGYVLYLSHGTVDGKATVSHHLYFEPSFTGEKVYSFPTLVPIELKTWEDGSKRYLDKQRGLLVSYPNGYVERGLYFFNCVDFKLKSGSKHRCNDFDMTKAVRVSESNVVETAPPPPGADPSR